MPDRRWRCPGPLCGDFQGYQRGCRSDACTASVAPAKARRDQAAMPRSRSRPIDTAAKAQVLRLLRGGATLNAAAAALGVTDYRLRSARQRDPEWEAQIRTASSRPLGDRRFTEADGVAYLDELRAGHDVQAAATRIGWEYSAVYYRRLTNPEFDLAVVQAAERPTSRPGPAARPVHRLNGPEEHQP